MSPDAAVSIIMPAIVTLFVLYLIWDRRHYNEQSERRREQQDLALEIRRELYLNENASLRRCRDLQRKLDEHRRILKYLASRLS